MIDTFELNKLRYKVLFSFYSKCQGLLTSIIWAQGVAQNLHIDEESVAPFERAVRYLRDEFLIERKALGEGYSLTYQGFDELEGSIVSPYISTPHFPPNISKYVDITNEIKDEIASIRGKRSLFLTKAYQLANGDTQQVINGRELANILHFDGSEFRKIYEYLEASGRIEYRFSGGGFSISQQGLIEIEEPMRDPSDSYDPSMWINLYPTLESAYDLIIDKLDQINTYCKTHIGCKIFTSNAKLLKDLRNDIEVIKTDNRNRNIFVLIVALVSSLIDQVDTDDILKYTKKSGGDNRSLNLMKELFDSNKINYDNKLFEKLRLIRNLRNKIPPIHPADHEAVEIYRCLGIDPDDNDWGKAAEVYVSEYINCLDMIKSALRNGLDQ